MDLNGKFVEFWLRYGFYSLYFATVNNSNNQCRPSVSYNINEWIPYFIKYSAHFFYIEIDAEIFNAHYSWKVAKKGFMINSSEIILEI